jgi:hypothetical protein
LYPTRTTTLQSSCAFLPANHCPTEIIRARLQTQPWGAPAPLAGNRPTKLASAPRPQSMLIQRAPGRFFTRPPSYITYLGLFTDDPPQTSQMVPHARKPCSQMSVSTRATRAQSSPAPCLKQAQKQVHLASSHRRLIGRADPGLSSQHRALLQSSPVRLYTRHVPTELSPNCYEAYMGP